MHDGTATTQARGTACAARHLQTRCNGEVAFVTCRRPKEVAFVASYRIGTAYYFYETGYDPAWAHASVGKILPIEILTLLLAEGTVRRFDFLYGDQDYKRRLANRTWQDAECYLLPRTARNRALAAAIGGTRAGAELAGRALDHWG